MKEYDTEILNELLNLYSSLCSNQVTRNEIDLQAESFILRCKNINFVQNLSRLDDGIGFLMQQDAQEFLDALFKQINIEIYESTIPWVNQNTIKQAKKDLLPAYDYETVVLKKTSFHKLYNCIVSNKIGCKNGHSSSSEIVDCAFLQLNLPQSINNNESVALSFLFENYINDEVITGTKCSTKCQEPLVRKTLLIEESPSIICIQIIRMVKNIITFFDDNEKKYITVNEASKNTSFINFPLNNLDIKCLYDMQFTSCNYDLCAVVCHEGSSLNLGHYKTYCIENDNSWSVYDDMKQYVQVVNDMNPQSRDYTYCCKYAYMLFYVRKKIEEIALNLRPNETTIDTNLKENINKVTSNFQNFKLNDDQENEDEVPTETIIDFKRRPHNKHYNYNDHLITVHYNKINTETVEDFSMFFFKETNEYNLLSGLHALNNAIQRLVFTQKSLDAIVLKRLKKQKDDEEDYDLEDLLKALEEKQIIYKDVTTQLSVADFQQNEKKCAFLVDSKPNFYALRRFTDYSPMWIMDSAEDTVKVADENYWSVINRKFGKKLNLISIIEILDDCDLPKVSNSSIEIEKDSNNIENKKIFKKTKFDDILQDLDELKKNESNKKVNTIERYRVECYEMFCFQNGFEAWPVSEIFILFLSWLDDMEYAPQYINSFYMYICKFNNEVKNLTINDDLKYRLRRVMIDIFHDPTNKKPGKGAEPCLLSDVKLIIESIPRKYQYREMMSSLFLFAVNTGARAITCCNMKLKDIVYFASKLTKFIKSVSVIQFKK